MTEMGVHAWVVVSEAPMIEFGEFGVDSDEGWC